jgi:hypothetical protein
MKPVRLVQIASMAFVKLLAATNIQVRVPTLRRQHFLLTRILRVIMEVRSISAMERPIAMATMLTMQRVNSLIIWLATLVLKLQINKLVLALVGVAFSPYALAIQAPEKKAASFLKIAIAVAPSQARVKGDMLGIHAVEVIPCDSNKTSRLTTLQWVNHRERFDHIGAKVVTARVPLDRARQVDLGRIDIESGQYCHLRFTLMRLPIATHPELLPALDTSLRLARPGQLQPVLISYAIPFVLPLPKPWAVSDGPAVLTVRLDPASANAVLADPKIDAGTIEQRIMMRWKETSLVSLKLLR